MVRVSKKHLDKNLKMESWLRFLDAIKTSKSEETLFQNIKKFLTSAEIVMLEKRLAIPILLERGLSYRTIGEIIDVSPNTISFVKHNLTRVRILKKMKKNEIEKIVEKRIRCYNRL